MLLNYLKLALRRLARNPFFSALNVLGLSIGLASFFILWQYSVSGLKADQYHKNFDRIGRICANWNWSEEGQTGHSTWGNIMASQFGMIVADFPEIEDHTRVIPQQEFSPDLLGLDPDLIVTLETTPGNKMSFSETKVICADSNFFNFFTVPWIHGHRSTALSKPNSVVLSQATAYKYFGNVDPTDRVLVLDDGTALMVSGVFENLPENTHLSFDMVISMVGRDQRWNDALIAFTRCYVKLKAGSNLGQFTRRLNFQKEKYWSALLKSWPQCQADMFLQPLNEIVFSNAFDRDSFEPKSKSTFIALAVVAVIILMIAWINYMNLTVSTTVKRLKEIATRKISGAYPADLMKQFLVESLIINLFSLGLALTWVQLLRLPFRIYLQIDVRPLSSIPWSTWSVLLLLMCVGVVLTAVYPFWISLTYRPRSLVAMDAAPGAKRMLPFLLSSAQSAVAFVLILMGFIMHRQLDYILHKELGLDKSGVLIVDMPALKSSTREADCHSLLTEIRRSLPATYSHSVLGDHTGDGIRIKRPGQNSFKAMHSEGGVDETFIPFYNIKLLAGRNFRSEDPDNVIIISRYAAERLGFINAQDALGARIDVTPKFKNATIREMEIIGVISDYSQGSFINAGANDTQAVTGAGIALTFKSGGFGLMTPEKISIRVNESRLDEQLNMIGAEFQKIFSTPLFNWYFLDEHINLVYDKEKVTRNQITFFAGLAIAIACLGLLSDMSNTAGEKIKEIGIRKVLGARSSDIGAVLLKTTLIQTIVAVVLGLTVSYYLVNQYLERYSERIPLHWWHFTAPIIVVLAIMATTISSVLWKATRSNPVEALKHE